MARLPRLALAGRMHYGIQRAQGTRPLFVDEADRRAFLDALFDAAGTYRVALHAWALRDDEVQWLATPADAAGLSAMVQAVGRRYVSAYNRRHGGRGSLWAGRFRCGVVEPGAWALAALVLVDGQPGASSAGSRTGSGRDARLADPPEYWQLGNTPFEREAHYRARLAAGLAATEARSLRDAALGGWAVGAWAPADAGSRALAPRRRGRPPKA